MLIANIRPHFCCCSTQPCDGSSNLPAVIPYSLPVRSDTRHLRHQPQSHPSEV